MSKFLIPHDAWVFVGDGKKALFLRNAGDEKFLNLKAERVFAEDNPPSQAGAPGKRPQESRSGRPGGGRILTPCYTL